MVRIGLPPASFAVPGGAVAMRPRVVLGVLGQLVLIALVIQHFRIESVSFLRLFTLAVAGFAVHYFLPFRYRLPFFVALSLAGIQLVLGLQQGAWLVAAGLVLIGICHLPIPFAARIAILVAAGLALIARRIGFGEVPWSPAVWPILGSMFFFRLINYLYDLKHNAGPARPAQTLAYFFLLPNVCFPLFPVVDFKKFCRNYYDAERHAVYQRGVQWIWRGIVQLLLYRLVYYHVTIDTLDVNDLGDLLFYAVSTFLLYVRISGNFHIIIGILHLFGFNLPETHQRYFFAASFTDFWRRINIYWKDFMMKVFYYPAFFRLRKGGETRALVIATLATFFCTWFLHLIQWVWIRGSLLLEWHDILFWSVFALLVLVNSVIESRRGRARSLGRRARSLRESAGLVARTVGTFMVICILWSLWTSESIADWLLMLRAALVLPAWGAARSVALIGALAAGLTLAVCAVWRGWGSRPAQVSPFRAALPVVLGSLVLLTASAPAISSRVGDSGRIVESLRATSLSRRDAEQFQRGYYENLLAVNRFNFELHRIYEKMPGDFVRSLARAGLSRPTGDYQDYQLIPLGEGRFFGAMTRTNRWGQRDRDYTQERPPGTYRIDMIGASHAMGSGVEDNETFESLVEERLNRADAASGRPRYEILNFAVAGYSPLHNLYQLENRAFSFEPNAVMYVAHANDSERAMRQCVTMAVRGTTSPYEFVEDTLREAGIRAGMGPNEATRRMKPHADGLLAWTYRRMVEDCVSREVLPIFVYLQSVTESDEAWRAPDRVRVLELAHQAGFVVFDLTGVFDGYDPAMLAIIPGDPHPNALGNRLVAERLYTMLRGPDGPIQFAHSP